jgi:molybdenum cofactor cytidylyltransferase
MTPRSNMSETMFAITPIILAAGDSTRMGYPKALLPIGDSTFLARILETVRRAGLAEPILILGKASEIIRLGIKDWRVSIQINPDPDRGQLSSIQLGLSSIQPDAHACMIWPVDQPAVSEDLVRNLARLFMESEPLIAFPKYGEQRGHPAIFHRKIFQEFMEAPLEEGPKKIILRHQKDTAELPANESAVVQDIDTPADYEALTGESLESALSRRRL